MIALEGTDRIRLAGRFDPEDVADARRDLAAALGDRESDAVTWDLGDVERLDTATAVLLWQRWGQRRPARLQLPGHAETIFDRLAELGPEELHHAGRRDRGGTGPGWLETAPGVLQVLGRFVLDLLLVARRPALMPWRELSAAAYRTSVTALPIVCVVGVLIGIVLSYLSSLQLRQYGAESFLPLILGIGVVRELGPMLAAIVIAGRSGSAITAGLGAMRLTQELDALSALGISHSLRLVLPRTLALAITLPLLVVCTNIAALLGGMVSGWVELDLAPATFIAGLANDVPLGHLLIGLFKAVIFGLSIGLIACHAGLSAQANTQSLAQETTRSVVLAISSIILLDAIFAILFRSLP
ncbi:MAG: ABC transporter permease [Pseudomonadota bacterium]